MQYICIYCAFDNNQNIYYFAYFFIRWSGEATLHYEHLFGRTTRQDFGKYFHDRHIGDFGLGSKDLGFDDLPPLSKTRPNNLAAGTANNPIVIDGPPAGDVNNPIVID